MSVYHAGLKESELHVSGYTGTDALKVSIIPRVGDRYIATDTNKIYECFVAETWIDITVDRIISGSTEVLISGANVYVKNEDIITAIFEKDNISIRPNGIEALKLDINGIVDLPKQSLCQITKAANQTIANDTWTQLAFDTLLIDLQLEADLSNNGIKIKKDGKYRVTAKLGGSGFTDELSADIKINGVSSSILYGAKSNGMAWGELVITEVFSLFANDLITVSVWGTLANLIRFDGTNAWSTLTVEKIR